MIQLPLKLYENAVTLLLVDEISEDEDENEGNVTDSDVSESEDDMEDKSKSSKKSVIENKRLAVDVDLALSPWSNARQYYDQKKSAAVKEQKTLQSSAKALKSTEKKIGADLKKGLKQEKELMRPQRKLYWFEKFIYFISSEGHLVIGSKDAQQTEILYQRYFRKGDVYVHADLQGASSVIVKNKQGKLDDPIPPSTLSQAGTLTVATSSAWDSKAVMSAWWVNAEQVSKTASSGDFLQPGNFAIKGQKNFLPPAQLILGFGLMFKISETSKARHLKHRAIEAMPKTTSEKAAAAEGAIQQSEKAHGPNDVTSTADETLERSHEHDLGSSEQSESDEVGTQDEEENAETHNPLQPNGASQVSAGRLEDDANHEVSDGEDDNDGENENSQHGGSGKKDASDTKTTATGNEDRGIRPISIEETIPLRKDEDPTASNDIHRAETATTAPDSHSANSPAALAPFTSKQPSTTAPSEQANLQVRGKHGKRQKQKTKYAGQDEEDRALAMRLLGSAAAQEKAKDDAAAKAAKEQALAEQKERRRRQHAMAAERGRQAEEARRQKFEEAGAGEDDEEGDGAALLDGLDAFIGAPLPGDEILDALVVCGPWDAIGSRCRWRVKMQPGTTKKGKAVKEILAQWNHVLDEGEKRKRPGSGEGNETMAAEEAVRKREGELIKAIRDVEIVGVVPVGKVRVVMGGGEKAARGGGGAGRGRRGGKGGKRK